MIVSTSIDLLCERALLRAGLSFKRIVQHRSGTMITVNHYRNVEYVDDALRISESDGHTDTVSADDDVQLDRVIATTGFEEYKSVGAQVHEIRGLDLSDSSDLVLYKYHGSQDVGESCALSTEHYLSLAVTPYVPDKVKEIIGNSPALFLLCGMLDADVRHAYHTLLRSAYENGGERRQRVAVVRPPKDEEDDNYRRMEIPMWEKAKDTLRDQMGIKVVEGDSAQFLNRFLQRFEEGAPVRA